MSVEAIATLCGMSVDISKSSHSEGDLCPDHIKAVFREFLDRAPAPAEIAVWMKTRSLRSFLEGVLSSQEYAQRVATRDIKKVDGPYLNCWIAGHLERFARPPGDVSPDGLRLL